MQINTFDDISGYKINMQKSLSFYTKTMSGKEIKKIIHFMVVSKK